MVNSRGHWLVVIAGGGMGRRFSGETGVSVPKQFLCLKGRSLLSWAIVPFVEALGRECCVVVALPREWFAEGRRVLGEELPFLERLYLVEGGETRFHSVARALTFAEGLAAGGFSGVLVHDAARPLVAVSLVRRCAEAVREGCCVVPVVVLKESAKRIEHGRLLSVDRRSVVLAQTPQGGVFEEVLRAYRQPYRDTFTDEAAVMEAAGFAVVSVEGQSTNVKLTEQIDWLLIKALAQEGLPPDHPFNAM